VGSRAYQRTTDPLNEMTTLPPSITLDSAPHPALSYAGLRAEALELLGSLCVAPWSDFNTHDPGITISAGESAVVDVCAGGQPRGDDCSHPCPCWLGPAP